jgi:L-glutamine-phosphate cytidylyltransferase
MKAIVLAAGRGSRLKALTDNLPKTLVRFNGRPLLEHTLNSLRQGGVSEIGIVAGYRKEMLEEHADTLFVNQEWASSGIFHSLSQAKTWLQNEHCLVSYSDIFYPSELVADMIAASGDIVVAYDPHAVALWQRRFSDPLADLERFLIDEDRQIRMIGGRPSSLDEVAGQYMGLIRVSPKGWQSLSAQQCMLTDPVASMNTDMTSLLSKTLQAGIPLNGVPTSGPWGEIDTPSDIEVYEALYPDL